MRSRRNPSRGASKLGSGNDSRPAYSLWGGRFESGLAPDAAALNRSLPIDVRLFRQEVAVGTAWARALVQGGVLSAEEADRISDGLALVGERIEAGAAEGAEDEDIHTLVERLLHEELGEVAGKLRAGRSRNDQVATIARLWCLGAFETLSQDILLLERALLEQAEHTVDIIAPSYTHLQRAQPIRMSQFFLSHFWPLDRDRRRLRELSARTSVMPLGSGAIAGSGFQVDRELLRASLGFLAITTNSMDAVSDRDFVAEFASTGALLGAHLSRLAEDLILFSGSEFGFVRFSDAYSTGSSLMPQKRNPDIAELARGKSAGLLAHATGALALLKSLPTGYNKDLQEDKQILFGVFDTLHGLLPPLAGAIETLSVDADAASRGLDPSLLAVDIADSLVRGGLTFHDAHTVVGRLVRAAEERGVTVLQVDGELAEGIHELLPGALSMLGSGYGATPYESSVEARDLPGGTSRSAILSQLSQAKAAAEY